jgi:hypothetical protein
MKAFAKYAVVLASGLALGFGLREPPSLEKFAKLPSLDEANNFVREAPAAVKPKAAVAPVDPAAAARVDEELDYLIAQRTKSLEGWRAFLSAHESGRYARDAKAEIDKLVAVETAPAKGGAEATPAALLVEASDSGPSLATNAGSANANHGSEGMQVATLNFEDICQRGAERLLEVGSSPADETDGSASETGCNKQRPVAPRLMDRSGLAPTAPAAAEPSNVSFDQAATEYGSANPSPAAHRAPTGNPHCDETAQDSLSSLVPEPASASPSPSEKIGSAWQA